MGHGEATFVADMPAEVAMKIELEVEDDQTEFEIELRRQRERIRSAAGPRGAGADTESACPTMTSCHAPLPVGRRPVVARRYCLTRPVPPSTVRTLPTNSRRLASTTGQRRCSHAPPF
jgi:hypothetical protein